MKGMPRSSRTVLLVEDDFLLRSALAEFLESSGFTVVSAANGLEALNLLTGGSVKPDVIVLDLVLPEMDGIEFRAIQRSIASIADVPVVVLTGSRELAAAVEQLRVTHLLSKPVDALRLLHVMEQLSGPVRQAS